MKVTLSLICVFLLACCSSSVDKGAEIEKLLLSDKVQKEAHMTGDANLLVSQIADSMISIQDGAISKASNEDIKQMFTNYFSQVTYRKWDNIDPPVIHISDDTSQASVTVNKIVEIKRINAPDSTYSSTTFAWTTIYRKEKGKWRIYSITSTRAPD